MEARERLKCENTDQVVFENKIAKLEFDLTQSNRKVTDLTTENSSLSILCEELKGKDRDQSLKIELLTNQVQSNERQLSSKVAELQQSSETISKQHTSYSKLLKETDQQGRERD